MATNNATTHVIAASNRAASWRRVVVSWTLRGAIARIGFRLISETPGRNALTASRERKISAPFTARITSLQYAEIGVWELVLAACPKENGARVFP